MENNCEEGQGSQRGVMSVMMMKFPIFQKFTKTDIIINHHSFHPCKKKVSSINYLLIRLHDKQRSKSDKNRHHTTQ
jgi:hypothetical protein